MQPIFERLYARLGWRYIWVGIVFALVCSAVFGAVTVADGMLFFDPTLGEYLKVTAVAQPLILAGELFGIWLARRPLMAFVAWLRGERDQVDALEAWTLGTVLPGRLVVGAALSVAVTVIPGELYMRDVVGASWGELAFIVCGSLMGITAAAAFVAPFLEAAIRPVMIDIARQLPTEFEFPHRGRSVRSRARFGVSMAIIFTAVTVAAVASVGSSPGVSLALAVGVAVVATATAALPFTAVVTSLVLNPVEDLIVAVRRVRAGDIVADVPVVAANELGVLARSFNGMLRGLREREALGDALGSYVSPDFVGRILESGKLIEGEEVHVTVLFVDIRDFTSYAERSGPAEAVALLNDFFELVVPIIGVNGGHANKFIGDGLLAAFGAPRALDDHAAAALETARDITDAVDRAFEGEIQTGIGINSGPVIAGTIGGGGRLEFAVIGDTVNVAARIQELTKQTGDRVLATQATLDALRLSDHGLATRGALPVRGRAAPISLYALPAA